jgi:hypothetical protein
MTLPTPSLNLAALLVAAGLATLWAVLPEKYTEWVQAMKEKLKRTPAMRAGVERVDAINPLSSSKPWYPKHVRAMGILMWVVLLSIAYMVYKF